MIKPTVGRVLWYHPTSDRTLVALICDVKTDVEINIVFFGETGSHHALTSVWLWQEDSEFPKPTSNYCEWMPYQIGQARKDAEKVFT